MNKNGNVERYPTAMTECKAESKRPAFDDLLKFSRYTVYITALYTFSLLAQSLQLLFMSFGGAQPIFNSITCTNVPSDVTLTQLTTKQACQIASDAHKLYNGSCKLNFVYKYGSVFHDFDVECNPDVIRISTSVQNAGLIAGTLISGYFANKYGRIKTYAATLLLLTISVIASSFSTSVLYFTVIRFFVMMFTAGSHNVSHIFVIENLPPNLRSIIPSFISYALAFVMVAVIAHFSSNWRMLTYVSAAVTLIPLFLLIFAIETPSFIFSKANRIKYKTCKNTNNTSGKVQSQNRLGKTYNPEVSENLDKQWKLRREAKLAALSIETFCGASKSLDFERKWRNAAIQQRICEIATERKYFLQKFTVHYGLDACKCISRVQQYLPLPLSAFLVWTSAAFKDKVKPENPALEWVLRGLAWLVLGTANQMYIIHHVQSSETFPTPIRAVGCTIVQTANRFGTAAGPLLLLTRKYGSSVPYLTMTVMFAFEIFLYINYSYGCCNRRSKENAIIRETKGLPKPEFMPSEAEAFARHLKTVHLEDTEINYFT
uniref:MFS domain-containing protein n=1 Tax=Syphacia muris TaxID=451379 RepID=A0A0N5ATX3_9BILA